MGAAATDAKASDVNKLLVGLNQLVVVNGKTLRNTNTMANHLIPVLAQASYKWVTKTAEDAVDTSDMYSRHARRQFLCLFSTKRKMHAFYRLPRTAYRIKAAFTAAVWSPTARVLDLPFMSRLLDWLSDRVVPAGLAAISDEVKNHADEKRIADEEAAYQEEIAAANPDVPVLIPAEVSETTTGQVSEMEPETLKDDCGAATVTRSNKLWTIRSAFRDKMIGSYIVLKPETVLNSPSLSELVGAVAKEVLIILLEIEDAIKCPPSMVGC